MIYVAQFLGVLLVVTLLAFSPEPQDWPTQRESSALDSLSNNGVGYVDTDERAAVGNEFPSGGEPSKGACGLVLIPVLAIPVLLGILIVRGVKKWRS